MDNNTTPTTKCPCCGSDTLDYLQLDFLPYGGPINAALLFAHTDKPSEAVGRKAYYPVYAKRCSTCGHIALFDKAIVDGDESA